MSDSPSSAPPSRSVEQLHAWKLAAAEVAVTRVQSGMVVGLGTGSTAILAVRRIGELLAAGELRDIVGVPTSTGSEHEARRLKIPLAPLDDPPAIDLTIDGADEIDPQLNLIKGGGGALLREKLISQLSRQELIIADETKLSPRLGTHWPVPIEVTQFAWGAQRRFLQELGAKVVLRQGPDQQPFRTDQGNYILDCNFGPLDDPRQLAAQLATRAGIVEHGLFLGLASEAIICGPSGQKVLQRNG